MKKKIALITGASRGIGEQFAKNMAKKNIHVILLARDKKKLEQVYDEIEKNGGSSTILQFYLRDLQKIPELTQIIIEKFGRLDFLVLNAAYSTKLKPICDQKMEDWLEIFHVNLHANFFLLKTVHTLLIQNNSTVIGIIDEKMQQNTPYWAPYSISKNAFYEMLQTYQKENIDNIKVKFFSPQTTKTNLQQKFFPEMEAKNPQDLHEKIIELIED